MKQGWKKVEEGGKRKKKTTKNNKLKKRVVRKTEKKEKECLYNQRARCHQVVKVISSTDSDLI